MEKNLNRKLDLELTIGCIMKLEMKYEDRRS